MGGSLLLRGSEKLEIESKNIVSYVLRVIFFFIFLNSLERERGSLFFSFFVYCNFHGIVYCSNKSSCSCCLIANSTNDVS